MAFLDRNPGLSRAVAEIPRLLELDAHMDSAKGVEDDLEVQNLLSTQLHHPGNGDLCKG